MARAPPPNELIADHGGGRGGDHFAMGMLLHFTRSRCPQLRQLAHASNTKPISGRNCGLRSQLWPQLRPLLRPPQRSSSAVTTALLLDAGHDTIGMQRANTIHHASIHVRRFSPIQDASHFDLEQQRLSRAFFRLLLRAPIGLPGHDAIDYYSGLDLTVMMRFIPFHTGIFRLRNQLFFHKLVQMSLGVSWGALRIQSCFTVHCFTVHC